MNGNKKIFLITILSLAFIFGMFSRALATAISSAKAAYDATTIAAYKTHAAAKAKANADFTAATAAADAAFAAATAAALTTYTNAINSAAAAADAASAPPADAAAIAAADAAYAIADHNAKVAYAAATAPAAAQRKIITDPLAAVRDATIAAADAALDTALKDALAVYNASVAKGSLDDLKGQASGLNKLGITDPPQLIGRFIKILLAFIGSISLVLYIYAGILWMTASGASERVDKAKKILVWTTLGVVVMLASYMLASFIFKSLGL